MPNRAVLIIDDQESTVLGRFLMNLEVDYEAADSIESALQSIQEKRPFLIFLDVLLGVEEDGIQFLKRRQKSKVLSSIPVLMISGKGDLDTIYQSLEWGADGYLIKPFTQRTLKEKLVEFFILPKKEESKDGEESKKKESR